MAQLFRFKSIGMVNGGMHVMLRTYHEYLRAVRELYRLKGRHFQAEKRMTRLSGHPQTSPMRLEAQRNLEQAALRLAVTQMDIDDYESHCQSEPAFPRIADIEHLGRWLILARLQTRTSQEELARRIGWSRQFLQKLEKKTYAGTTLNTLKRVAEELLKIRSEQSPKSTGAPRAVATKT